LLTDNKSNFRGPRTLLNLAAGVLWRMPGRFGFARLFGRSYGLRCVVFHDISVTESPFTKGMRVSITPRDFEAALKFLTQYYTPVSLEEVLGPSEGGDLPPRPVLVTFDDGYASLMKWAAPMCSKFRVPGIVFLNAAFLDNVGLSPDNLVCYAANILGMEGINAAARTAGGTEVPELRSLAEVFSRLFPSISLAERQIFLSALAHLAGINERQLAAEAGLYLTREQLCDLAASGFEIGNHTYSHVRCRTLTPADFDREIGRNKAELEALSGKKVRSFSLPYGSAADLTCDLMRSLQFSGHAAVFLSESVANPQRKGLSCFDRVSIHANQDGALYFEVEVLPRLRALRNRFWRDSGVVRTPRYCPFQSRLATSREKNKP